MIKVKSIPSRNANGRLLLVGTILSLAVAAAFSEIFFWLVKSWFSFDRSYSFMILLLSLFMIWSRKEDLKLTPIEPCLVLGSLTTLAGCLIVVAGRLSSTLMVQGIALVVVLLGLVWLILGTRHLKILFVPVGYLFFMFYLLEELLGRFSSHLQMASAWIAANLIAATGMPVFLHGHLLALPHISLEVAQVCNGVNHIVALAAMSVPFAFLSQQSVLKKCLIVVGAFLVGLFSNGLRVALIGYWTKFYPEGPLHGPFDIFYVSFILIFGLAFFGPPAVLSKRWKKRQGSPRAASQSQVRELSREAWVGTWKQRVAVSAALGILCLANAYLYFHFSIPVDPKRDLNEFPVRIGQWEGRDIADTDWPAKHLNADVPLRRMYLHPSGIEIGLYVGYFRTQDQGRELINDRFNWLYEKMMTESIRFGSESMTIGKGVARGLNDQTFDGDRRVLYFWYFIDGRVYVSRYQTKLKLLMNRLFNSTSNGAIVIMPLENDDGKKSVNPEVVLSFVQEILTTLGGFL